jgi:transglutaminase-like putative cysteine protease
MFTIQAPPSADSMVSGQHYQVISLKFDLVADYLNAYDYKPDDVARDEPDFYERFTQLPERGTMDNPRDGFDFTRVRAKAYELTAAADTVYGKVDALLRYLQEDFKFSLNPPTAVPPESDAIDYFLFDWEPRRGHCENYSTALAVLCRSIGIPSRVVTGYLPGTLNFFRNRYVVQERHAHAWTEIFWPEIGWVEFDPSPQTWSQSFGESVSGGWVEFHNAMENLYIYDPKGFINDKIVPAFERTGRAIKYFANQRELDFYDFMDPLYRYNAENPGTVIGILLTGTAFLIAMALYRLRKDSGYTRREVLRRGGKCLVGVKKRLERRGISKEALATEEDCALEASRLSPQWGKTVGNLVSAYEVARYSTRAVSRSDLKSVTRSCRAARHMPRE